MKKVLIVTGEKSGEFLGKALISEIKKQEIGKTYIVGMTGNILSPYLDEVLVDSNNFAVIGFIEAMYKYSQLKSAQQLLIKEIKKVKFDLIILIDFIGFNLTIGRFAKKMNIPVILYVGPQIWAWKKNRIKKLKDCRDCIGLILPFEEKLYVNESFRTVYVGHPLVEILPFDTTKIVARKDFSFLNEKDLVISFLPGSRRSEIKNHFLLICETIVYLHKKYVHAKFIIALAKPEDISVSEIKEIETLKLNQVPVYVEYGKTHDIIVCSDAVGTASGTASLETALLKVPCVIFYRSSLISFLIFNLFSLTKYIGLPNIIMDRQVVPELIQNKLNTRSLSSEIIKLVENPDLRHKQISEFKTLKKKLGSKSASKTMAEMIVRALSNSGF